MLHGLPRSEQVQLLLRGDLHGVFHPGRFAQLLLQPTSTPHAGHARHPFPTQVQTSALPPGKASCPYCKHASFLVKVGPPSSAPDHSPCSCTRPVHKDAPNHVLAHTGLGDVCQHQPAPPDALLTGVFVVPRLTQFTAPESEPGAEGDDEGSDRSKQQKATTSKASYKVSIRLQLPAAWHRCTLLHGSKAA
jgi:hypothetical protein